MPLYHLLVDAALFHEQLFPILAAVWRARGFEPCRALATELLPRVREFAERYQLDDEEPFLAELARNPAFNLQQWRRLVSELLWFSAREIPELEISPITLVCLLAPGRHLQSLLARE